MVELCNSFTVEARNVSVAFALWKTVLFSFSVAKNYLFISCNFNVSQWNVEGKFDCTLEHFEFEMMGHLFEKLMNKTPCLFDINKELNDIHLLHFIQKCIHSLLILVVEDFMRIAGKHFFYTVGKLFLHRPHTILKEIHKTFIEIVH